MHRRHIVGGHRGALSGQGLCQRAADTAAGTGHQGHLTFKHRHGPPPPHVVAGRPHRPMPAGAAGREGLPAPGPQVTRQTWPYGSLGEYRIGWGRIGNYFCAYGTVEGAQPLRGIAVRMTVRDPNGNDLGSGDVRILGDPTTGG